MLFNDPTPPISTLISYIISCSQWLAVQIELGQLVWKYIYQSTPGGWTVTYNPRGPFVVIICSRHCYVLVNTGRFLHLTPVKAHHLVPAYTLLYPPRLSMTPRCHWHSWRLERQVRRPLKAAQHSRWHTTSSLSSKASICTLSDIKSTLWMLVGSKFQRLQTIGWDIVKHQWVSPFVQFSPFTDFSFLT